MSRFFFADAHRKFDGSKSSTYQPLGYPWRIGYLDGTATTGTVSQDVVTVTDLFDEKDNKLDIGRCLYIEYFHKRKIHYLNTNLITKH
jgi:hypothetical protein